MDRIRQRQKIGLFYNSIAIIILIVFIWQNTAVYALPLNNSPISVVENKPLTSHSISSIDNLLSSDFYIPENYGSVLKKWSANSTERLIINIQDAHCHYEAQHNISKILELLVRDYGVNLVAVEGAIGSLDLSQYDKFEDEEAKRKAVDRFVKKGYVTGPEYLNITKYNKLPFGIYGVEDGQLYVKNLISFRETWINVKETEYFTNELAKIIDGLKETIYSKELLEFDKKIDAYERTEVSLIDLIKYLRSLLDAQSLVLEAKENFNLVIKAIDLEKNINFKEVDRERKVLIKRLEKNLVKKDLEELVKKSLEFRLGKISSLRYYEYLESTIEDQSDYSNLINYIKLIKLQSIINNFRLFEEIDLIINAIKDKLFQNIIQDQLWELSYKIKILGKLFHLELSKKDLEYFESNRDSFTVSKLLSFIKIQAPLYNIGIPAILINDSLLETVDKCILPANKFYKTAIQRDKVLVENTLTKMNEDNKDIAVMVTGGFHTEGITSILQNKGINYIVITPRITKEQLDNPYLSIMLDEDIKFNTNNNINQNMLAVYEMLASNNQLRELIGGIPRIGEELRGLMEKLKKKETTIETFREKVRKMQVTEEEKRVVRDIILRIEGPHAELIKDLIADIFELEIQQINIQEREPESPAGRWPKSHPLYVLSLLFIVACGGDVSSYRPVDIDSGVSPAPDAGMKEEPDAGEQEEEREVVEVYPGDSIQAAIDSAEAGYIVRVHPGEYPLENEPIPTDASAPRLVLKPGVCLVSVAGPSETIIRGVRGAYLPTVVGADNATLEGFTIIGSSALSLDGVSDMIIRDNHIMGYQPLSISSTRDSRSSGNTIEDNTIQMVGLGPGAVSLSGDNNSFGNNHIIGATFVYGNENIFERNIMELDNNTSLTQYALVLQLRSGSGNLLDFNTIYVPEFDYRPNDLQSARPIVEVWGGSTENEISNSIIAGWTDELSRIWVAEDSSVELNYTLVDTDDIEGPAGLGEGVIYGDPLFVDPDSGDLSLNPDSPAIDAGDPESPLDPDGTRADLGAVPYDHRMGDSDSPDSGLIGKWIPTVKQYPTEQNPYLRLKLKGMYSYIGQERIAEIEAHQLTRDEKDRLRMAAQTQLIPRAEEIRDSTKREDTLAILNYILANLEKIWLLADHPDVQGFADKNGIFVNERLFRGTAGLAPISHKHKKQLVHCNYPYRYLSSWLTYPCENTGLAALFHEAGHGYFDANPGVFISDAKLIIRHSVHQYLRGIGKRVRRGRKVSELSAEEKGLQDELFGEKNVRLSEEIKLLKLSLSQVPAAPVSSPPGIDLSNIPLNPGMVVDGVAIDIKGIIAEVARMLLEHPELKEQIEAIYVFGSIAKGTASMQREGKDYSSDIDLFVKFKDIPETGGEEMVPQDEIYYRRINRLRMIIEEIQVEVNHRHDIDIDIYHNAVVHPDVDSVPQEIEWEISGKFETEADEGEDRILIWGKKVEEDSASDFRDERELMRLSRAEQKKREGLLKMVLEGLNSFIKDKGRAVNHGAVGRNTDLPGRFDIDTIILFKETFQGYPEGKEVLDALKSSFELNGYKIRNESIFRRPRKENMWLVSFDVYTNEGELITEVEVTLVMERVLYVDMMSQQIEELRNRFGDRVVEELFEDIKLFKLFLINIVGVYKWYEGGLSAIGTEQLVIQAGGTENNGWDIKGLGSFTKAMEWIYQHGYDKEKHLIVPLEEVKKVFKIYNVDKTNFLDNLNEWSWRKMVHGARVYVEEKRKGRRFNDLEELRYTIEDAIGYRPNCVVVLELSGKDLDERLDFYGEDSWEKAGKDRYYLFLERDIEIDIPWAEIVKKIDRTDLEDPDETLPKTDGSDDSDKLYIKGIATIIFSILGYYAGYPGIGLALGLFIDLRLFIFKMLKSLISKYNTEDTEILKSRRMKIEEFKKQILKELTKTYMFDITSGIISDYCGVTTTLSEVAEQLLPGVEQDYSLVTLIMRDIGYDIFYELFYLINSLNLTSEESYEIKSWIKGQDIKLNLEFQDDEEREEVTLPLADNYYDLCFQLRIDAKVDARIHQLVNKYIPQDARKNILLRFADNTLSDYHIDFLEKFFTYKDPKDPEFYKAMNLLMSCMLHADENIYDTLSAKYRANVEEIVSIYGKKAEYEKVLAETPEYAMYSVPGGNIEELQRDNLLILYLLDVFKTEKYMDSMQAILDVNETRIELPSGRKFVLEFSRNIVELSREESENKSVDIVSNEGIRTGPSRCSGEEEMIYHANNIQRLNNDLNTDGWIIFLKDPETDVRIPGIYAYGKINENGDIEIEYVFTKSLQEKGIAKEVFKVIGEHIKKTGKAVNVKFEIEELNTLISIVEYFISERHMFNGDKAAVIDLLNYNLDKYRALRDQETEEGFSDTRQELLDKLRENICLLLEDFALDEKFIESTLWGKILKYMGADDLEIKGVNLEDRSFIVMTGTVYLSKFGRFHRLLTIWKEKLGKWLDNLIQSITYKGEKQRNELLDELRDILREDLQTPRYFHYFQFQDVKDMVRIKEWFLKTDGLFTDDPDEIYGFFEAMFGALGDGSKDPLDIEAEFPNMWEKFFWPSEELKRRIEPILQELSPFSDDLEWLFNEIFREPLILEFHFEESPGEEEKVFGLTIDRNMTDEYFGRLNMRKLPKAFVEVLKKHLSFEDCISAGLILRARRSYPEHLKVWDTFLGAMVRRQSYRPEKIEGFCDVLLNLSIAGQRDVDITMVEKKLREWIRHCGESCSEAQAALEKGSVPFELRGGQVGIGDPKSTYDKASKKLIVYYEILFDISSGSISTAERGVLEQLVGLQGQFISGRTGKTFTIEVSTDPMEIARAFVENEYIVERDFPEFGMEDKDRLAVVARDYLIERLIPIPGDAPKVLFRLRDSEGRLIFGGYLLLQIKEGGIHVDNTRFIAVQGRGLVSALYQKIGEQLRASLDHRLEVTADIEEYNTLLTLGKGIVESFEGDKLPPSVVELRDVLSRMPEEEFTNHQNRQEAVRELDEVISNVLREGKMKIPESLVQETLLDKLGVRGMGVTDLQVSLIQDEDGIERLRITGYLYPTHEKTANSLGIDPRELEGLLVRLDDVERSKKLKKRFLRLIEGDLEDELRILIDNIEAVMEVIDGLTGFIPEEGKREAVKRIALHLSIKHIQEMDTLESLPECMKNFKDRLREIAPDEAKIDQIITDLMEMNEYTMNRDGNIVLLKLDIYLRKIVEILNNDEELRKSAELVRKYLYTKAEAARRLKVEPYDIESITPATSIAKIVNGYLKERKDKDKLVDVLVRYLISDRSLSEHKDYKKIEGSIKRIISSKQLNEISPPDLTVPHVQDFRGDIENELDLNLKSEKLIENTDNKIILQHLAIYLSDNSNWDRMRLDNAILNVIRKLTDTNNQQIMAYKTEEEKRAFVAILEEKGVGSEQLDAWQRTKKLIFINISGCNTYSDVKRTIAEELEISETEVSDRLVSIIKDTEGKTFKGRNIRDDRIIVACDSEGNEDLYLTWKIAFLFIQLDRSDFNHDGKRIKDITTIDFKRRLRRLLTEYYKGTDLVSEIDSLIKKVMQGGIYIILPRVTPFVAKYYEALIEAERLINQAA